MAYKSKFLHFKTKASYEAERAKTTADSEERKVFDAYISFIDEGPTICTWGKEYQCDANSLSVLPQELTTEEQNQVFKNLGWNVHIISQSDIGAGSSPSNEEKAKRLEATALLVKETSLIYVRGKDDSANSYFFRTNSSTQIEVLRINTTTGIIYPTSTQFIDTGTIRFDRTQQLSNPQKQQARDNIGAISQAEVEALDLGLTEKDLISIDSDRVKLVSSGTVDKSFPYPELILSSNDIPDIKTSKTFNTSLLGDKLISTIDGKEVVSSKILLVIDYSGSSSQIFLYRVENAIEVTEGVDYTLYYQGLDSQYVLAIPFPNMVLGSTMTLYYNDISIPSPSSNPPKALGTANAGTSRFYSRCDHIHPIQESVAKLTTPRTIALTGAVLGSTTFDGSSNVSINSTLANIDASKITSGTINADRLPEIPISKIPAAAMERLYVVESQSAAMSLTIQEGDVVQIGSGGPMYFCVSESASTFATKFKEFTAGTATSVPWSGVTGAPTLSLRSLQVNAVGYQVYSNVATSIPMIYAPTEIGTSGQILQSTGNGAPKWVNQSSITANPSAHTQSYTTLTGSTITANQAIVSNGTANGWTLKTLGSLAFSSATIPTKTSQLTNDSGFLTSVPAQSWSSITDKPTFATVATSGSYNDLTNKPTIPSAYTLPTANASTLGGVKIGSNITVSSGTISLSKSNVTSALGYTPSSPLIQTGTITNNTITAGYAYDVSSAVVNMVRDFSESNPDAVVATASKITSFPSECSVMDGIMDLNGSVYVYCFTYIGGTVYINGAVYA